MIIVSIQNMLIFEEDACFFLLCTINMNHIFGLTDSYKLQLPETLSLSITSITAMTVKRNNKYKIVCDRIKAMTNINQQDIALLTCNTQNVDSTIDSVLNPNLYYYYNQVCIPLQPCDEINFYLTDEQGNRVSTADEILCSVNLFPY